MISHVLMGILDHPRGDVRYHVLAVNAPHNVTINDGGRLEIECAPGDLPRGGLIIVGARSVRPHLSDWSAYQPFAVNINGVGTREIRRVNPNPHWQFVEGGNGELASADDEKFTLQPGELCYFDCFTSSRFDRIDATRAILESAGAGEQEMGLFELLRMGSTGDAMILVKILANSYRLALVATDLHKTDNAKKDRRLRGVRAGVDMLLRKDPNNPLCGLVGEPRTPGTSGNLVASVVCAIGNATGLPRADLPGAKWIEVNKNWVPPIASDIAEYWKLGDTPPEPASADD